jgi:hypothetical protein
MKNKKKYGVIHFLFDFTLGVLTGGLWWLFLLLRYLSQGGR